MSWLFSQALVEEYSEDNSLDGEQCAPLKLKSTPRAYLSSVKMTDFSRLSQSGMTFAPLTDALGAGLLMWFQGAFPARTYRQQEPERGLTGSEAVFGQKCGESLAKFDPDTHSLKTAQCSLFEDSTEFCVTLPRWGLMLAGELYQQPTLGRITKEKESGLLPTTLATDWKGGTTAIRKDRGNQRMDQWRDYVKVKYSLTYPHPTHSEMRMGWPPGWTDLKPLETDKCRNKQPQHGES